MNITMTTKKILLILIATCVSLSLDAKQRPGVNTDESKVPTYTLEDPLVFSDGRKVKNKKQWKQRKEEILDIFQKEMYGQMPPAPDTLILDSFDDGSTLMGMARRRQVRMWFKADRTGPHIDWLIVSPTYATEPTPVIIMLNFDGNHTILEDGEIPVTKAWKRITKKEVKTNFSDGSDRGSLSHQEGSTIIPLATIIVRGYSYMTACYCEVSPDPGAKDPDYQNLQKTFAYTGVFDLWGQRDNNRSDNTSALCAWAWALSRGQDLAERLQGIDASRTIVTGCSRLAKAALLAGAFDERFSITVSVQAGGGGATLSKRVFGENVSTMTQSFPHWYCSAYAKYASNEKSMPFDQHLLLSCIAPRALLVEGFNKPWFDTKGEFLAIKAASPVWPFLGKTGLPATEWPADFDTKAIGTNLGYVRRPGEHGINGYDWMWMLDFADNYFKK